MTLKNSVHIHSDLQKVNRLFETHGFKAYLVGGAVRDMLLGKEIHDFDIATNATPEQIMKIFHKVIPTGIAHGTVTILIYGHQIEATTFRTETEYSDGRHPDKVAYAATIEEDLSRRDFTMNAIAADLKDGSLTDPFNGREDIKNGIIRTVGNPLDRFTEDGLRPVRAIRFASQLNFKIEEGTYRALNDPKVLEKTKKVSVERFRDEFCKILKTEKPSVGLKYLVSTGIMNIFIPEFNPCVNCAQADERGFHEFDVAHHLFYSTDGAPKDNLIVRLAAFYHDIGKPEAKTIETVTIDSNSAEHIHFHGHETISAKKAKRSLTNLKFSNVEIDAVTHLVKEHMFHYESAWSDAAVRRFIIRIGLENFENLLALRLADIHGMHNCPLDYKSPSWNLLMELQDRIQKVQLEKSALSLKDLAINGNDLMENGIPKGKALGLILKELFEAVTDSPEMNDKEKLLECALKLWKNKYKDLA